MTIVAHWCIIIYKGVKIMATEKPRYNITVDDEMLNEIEKYRYDHRIATRSGATVELLKKGIDEFYRRISEEEAQKNKAPTEESAAEALYEVLYYYLGRPPSPEEVISLRSILPIICNGISGAM